MEKIHKECLLGNLVTLCEDLEVKDVQPHLEAAGIINISDVERIYHKVTSQERVTKLVHILITRGPSAYPALLDGLNKTHSHLADLLNCWTTTHKVSTGEKLSL